MDDAVVSIHDEESRLALQEMMQIADSLEPSRDALASLTKEEANPFESVVKKMGPDFGTLYVPTYVPEGYSLTRSQAQPGWGYSELRYRKFCELNIQQYAQGSPMGSEIVRRATFGPWDTVVERGNEIHIGYQAEARHVQGVRFYVSDPHPIPATQHWLEYRGAWLNISASAHPACEILSIDEIARIANSLKPVD